MITLRKIVELNEITVEKMEIMPDHVHALINFNSY
ncbi:transposase [Paucilactobacillus vaccinostercus]